MGKRREGATPKTRARAVRYRLLLFGATVLALIYGYGVTAQAATKFKVLFSFKNERGAHPFVALLADGAGNFYGTTAFGGAHGKGTVFELSPPTAGNTAWTETVLLSFGGANGYEPATALLADGAGGLYGTTAFGGANRDGVVFDLSPPAGGQTTWTETVLKSFIGSKGFQPGGNLIADGVGNLYGTTAIGGTNDPCPDSYGCGDVFELSPPAAGATAWTETVLQLFSGTNGETPIGGLIADGAGNLYGTTWVGGANNDGAVFELSPPAAGATVWTETVLLSFNVTNGETPNGSLIVDGAGNLYGTAYRGGANGDGVVFELSPPTAGTTAWTENLLVSFNGTKGQAPAGGLVEDGAGNLYGTTYYGGANNDGVVFMLRPPTGNQAAWTETVLQSFNGTNGAGPRGSLIADGVGNLYGTTNYGGAHDEGVAFRLAP